MHLKRRQFLKISGILGASAFLSGPLWAAPGRSEKTLVLLHLNGGNDGLNTVVPYRDPLYRKLRPSLALPSRRILPLDKGLGLHPSLGGLKKLYDKGTLAVVNGVGYPDPSLSHFKSTEIWYGAGHNSAEAGWVGRFLESEKTRESGLGALALSPTVPLSLQGKRSFSPCCTELQQFQIPSGVQPLRSLYGAMSERPGMLGEVARIGSEGLEVASRLSRLEPISLQNDVGEFGRDLGTALSLIEADLGLRVIQLTLEGFDTHVAQAQEHEELMYQLGEGLHLFQTELERRGLDSKVLTLVFSEFGRRPQENDAGGTDHGTAGPLFLVGKGVKAGLHGDQPRLDNLQDGNLRYQVDFRDVYAAVLRDWFRVKPNNIVSATSAKLHLVG